MGVRQKLKMWFTSKRIFALSMATILLITGVVTVCYFIIQNNNNDGSNALATPGLSTDTSNLNNLSYINAVYDSNILTDKPVGFWGMNNPSGSEADITGNGHVGTYKNGAPQLTTLLNGDKAVDFNGSNQYMTIPSSADFSIPTTKKLTWEAWIRPDTLQFPSATDGYSDFLGKCAEYSPSCEWEGRMYSTTNSENRCNRLSAYVFNPTAGLGSGADWQPNCNLLQANQWLHVVGEYQTETTPSGCSSTYPGTIEIWVNGVKWNSSYHRPTGCMSQYKIKPVANNSPVNIGEMAGEYAFKGAIGKVAIYNYLLSQSQINGHFAAMTGVQPSGSCENNCTIPVPTPTATSTDATPPTVSITSPTSGVTISGTQTITATASDNKGVSKVEFYDGSNLLGSSTASPYSVVWNTLTATNSTHSLTAKAYDLSNNNATSSAVTVTISNYSSDTTAPSTPTGLSSTSQTDKTIVLKWNAATDNVGVTGYKLYRSGGGSNTALSTASTTFIDSNLASNTAYTYTISAFDAAGNESAKSASISASTQPVSVVGGLQVSVSTYDSWNTGYCANVTIKNTFTTKLSKWSTSFDVVGRVTSLWNAKWSQSGKTVSISNKNYNGTINAGSTLTGVGFCASNRISIKK